MRLPDFLFRARLGKPCAILLDLDGTLAPIQSERDAVRLERPWLDLLRRLHGRPSLHLALVSGRSLPDLRRRAPFPGMTLVGNHGMSWSKPSWGPRRDRARLWRDRMRSARPRLQALVKAFPGLEWEDKGLDACLHLRRLKPSQRQALLPVALRLAKRSGLQCLPALESLELEPLGAWNKGHAVRRLQDRLVGNGLCFYAGDDNTDEWAFRALSGRRHCLTYKVGAGPTWAQLQGGRAQLWLLLNALLRP